MTYLSTAIVPSDEDERTAEPVTIEQQPIRELHLVRVEDSEFYFFEFEAAMRKLCEEPEATFERITVH